MSGIRELIRNCKEGLKIKSLRRMGNCSRCGDCCTHAGGMEFTLEDPYDFKVDRRGGCCPYFDKSTKLCELHPHKKSLLCKCWPLLPEHIEKFPSCTYRFVEKA